MPLTLVQLAERIGIPEDRFEELIQVPIVARALTVAAKHSNFPPGNVWKAVGRPTIYGKDGLDIESLDIELEKLTRAEDGQVVPERASHPILTGRMHVAEEVARRRLAVIQDAFQELKKTGTASSPGDVEHLGRARARLRVELHESGMPT